jgi:hypothetical protein
LEQRRQRILPVHYFHVVFTVPRELREVALRNKRRFYTLLLRTAAETLLALGRDPKRLGALLGVTAVLHTWTRDLRFHPHVHCIVTGGGLSLERDRWVRTGPKYLFPVKVLAQLFRGKLLDALTRAVERAEVDLPDSLPTVAAFTRLRARLYRKDWCVYAKRPFAGPDQVFAYLGRYTHRVGISNHRILVVSDEAVTLATRNGGKATMTPLAFIRRFLQHVLPARFVKIRHYGLLAPSHVNTRLLDARRVLGQPSDNPPDDAVSLTGWRALLQRLTGIDPDVCPNCGSRSLLRFPLTVFNDTRPPRGRAPPRAHP